MDTGELIANSIHRLELTDIEGAAHVAGLYLFDAIRSKDSELIEIMNACHYEAMNALRELDWTPEWTL